MPLSRDLKTGPRNHYVDSLAFDFTHIGDSLCSLSAELSGRASLPAGDIAEIETLIARAHAELDRASTTLIFNHPALISPGASNDFMGRWIETQRATVAPIDTIDEIAEAQS